MYLWICAFVCLPELFELSKSVHILGKGESHGITVNHRQSQQWPHIDPCWSFLLKLTECMREEGMRPKARMVYTVWSTFYSNHFHWIDLTLPHSVFGSFSSEVNKSWHVYYGMCPSNIFNKSVQIDSGVTQYRWGVLYCMCAVCRSAVLWMYVQYLTARSSWILHCALCSLPGGFDQISGIDQIVYGSNTWLLSNDHISKLVERKSNGFGTIYHLVNGSAIYTVYHY